AVQFAVRVLEFNQLKGAIDHQQKQIGIDRLGKKIIGTKANGSDGVLPILVATCDNDLGGGFKNEDGFDQFEPFRGFIWQGRKSQVDNDEAWGLASEECQCGGGIVGGKHFVIAERPSHLLLEAHIVLDQQNGLSRRTHRPTVSGGIPETPSCSTPTSGKETCMVVPLPGAVRTFSCPPIDRTYS